MGLDAHPGASLSNLPELFDLESRVHSLHDDVVKPALSMISGLLKDILYGDAANGRPAAYRQQNDFKNVRQYCEHRLGWSYEYCRMLIRAGDVIEANPKLGKLHVSVSAANELARLTESQRDAVVEAVMSSGVRPTAEVVRMYASGVSDGVRSVNADGVKVCTEIESGSNNAVVDSVDRRIESEVHRAIVRHSSPERGLLRVLDRVRIGDGSTNDDYIHIHKHEQGKNG
jgi:hypothetical protein